MSHSRKDAVGGHTSTAIGWDPKPHGHHDPVVWGKVKRYVKRRRSKMARRYGRMSLRDLEILELPEGAIEDQLDQFHDEDDWYVTGGHASYDLSDYGDYDDGGPYNEDFRDDYEDNRKDDFDDYYGNYDDHDGYGDPLSEYERGYRQDQRDALLAKRRQCLDEFFQEPWEAYR